MGQPQMAFNTPARAGFLKSVSPERANLRLVPPPGEAGRSDESLMLAASRGDASAFRELVSRHLATVRRFCARAGSAAAADELAQDTFTRLWQARTRWRDGTPFAPYLFAIATNLARNHHRGQGRRLRALEALAGEPAAVAPAPDAALERQAEVARIHEALQHLPEAQREAVLLRFGADLDSDALGEALGCNASTARSRVFFGLKRLREMVGVSS
jgi:RNA polymerase sigma-70 factor (ECF subfamily)